MGFYNNGPTLLPFGGDDPGQLTSSNYLDARINKPAPTTTKIIVIFCCANVCGACLLYFHSPLGRFILRLKFNNEIYQTLLNPN